MPKYLVEASYAIDGAKGLLKDGGTARRKAVETLMATMKGSVESLYFCFGERDVVIIVDAPDNVTAAAISMAVNASGSIRTRTTVLLTPEEIDEAAKRHVDFHAPGT